MRQKTHYYIHGIMATALLAMAACSEDMSLLGGNANKEEINLSAGYQTQTRVTDTGFADEDQMGVFIVDYSNGEAGSLADDDLHATNVRYTYAESSNTWTGATTLYWNDTTTPIDIYGYYPFDSNMEEPTAYAFSVKTNQASTATDAMKGGYEASDLLRAKAENIAPTSETIQLTYNHVMAGVTVRLEEGSGFSEGEWTAATKMVWIDNTVTDCIVDLEAGTVVPNGETVKRITPLEYNGDYRAVAVPQTIEAGKSIIVLTVNGTNYSLTKNVAFSFTSGKMHTFTIKVDKRTDTGDYVFSLVDESIASWIDDEDFHDGIVREYVVVNVEEPGGLEAAMKALGIDIATVSNLKITGTIDYQNDLPYISGNQEQLQNLNLYEVRIDDENDEYDDVIGNLGGCAMLTHVIFPKTLKGIAGRAFFDSRLLGSLSIPLGVEYIGGEAFGQNYSLSGTITLPSTLKRIEDGAFTFCPFRGELRLPEGLEYIGHAAFPSANFTGQLILPSTLKQIANSSDDFPGRGWGASVISGNFDGDLVIPQGIKELYNFIFNSAKFTGGLVLPEGLTKIGEHVFPGCSFKGELKLPSTLKEIGYNSFSNNKFTKIIWPSNLIKLGNNAFEGCNRLEGTITIPSSISAINEAVFNGCSFITGIELHSGIEYIGNNAFAGCSSVNSIVCHAADPPLFTSSSFNDIARNNFSVEVPANSVALYQQDSNWKEFKRITAYSNFVCRPQTMCALNAAHTQTIILNSDNEWTISHKPDWVKLSAESGTGKSQIQVTINEMAKGSSNREDYIEFALEGTTFTTRLTVSQYNYEYDEDQLVTLQTHTKGNGIKIVFIGDGWNGEDISDGGYMEQCKEDMEYFFGLPPYDRFRDYFDVYAAVALSQESGVNTLYTVRDTRFGTIYSSGATSNSCSGSNSALIPDEDLVFQYLTSEVEGLTEEDLKRGLTIMIPNCVDYGGVTYFFDDKSLSICPPSENAYPNDSRGILQHEACGHGFGKLGDESITYYMFAPTSALNAINDAHSKGWYQNLSTTGNMKDVPWAHLIYDNDHGYSDYVDVFEGGYGYFRSIYRSESNSCMNSGIPYFNAISRQDITKRILETAGETFDINDFYTNDTKSWGASSITTRSVSANVNVSKGICNHTAPVIVKGNSLRNKIKAIKRNRK